MEPERNVSITFGELAEQVECIASNLLDMGYRPERPFVIYLFNCVEFTMTMLAVWRLGGNAATINHLLTAGTFSYKILACHTNSCLQPTSQRYICVSLN